MKEGIPPYVSYRTFENFLSELGARGVPSRIDRSILAHKSGTVQSQLILALQYLGLITESGRSTQRLHSLVHCEGVARRKLLREILEESYRFVFQSDFQLEAASSDQAEELFRRTGASGETVRRCLSFFLAAARQSGIKISPYIKPHRGKTPARPSETSSKDTASPAPGTRSGGPRTFKRIDLKSGGSLTLELSFDVFELEPSDRQFVFDLIDRLNRYLKSEGARDTAEESGEFPALPGK